MTSEKEELRFCRRPIRLALNFVIIGTPEVRKTGLTFCCNSWIVFRDLNSADLSALVASLSLSIDYLEFFEPDDNLTMDGAPSLAITSREKNAHLFSVASRLLDLLSVEEISSKLSPAAIERLSTLITHTNLRFLELLAIRSLRKPSIFDISG